MDAKRPETPAEALLELQRQAFVWHENPFVGVDGLLKAADLYCRRVQISLGIDPWRGAGREEKTG